ncbi:MAG: hypothetical protein ACPL7L_06435, partial [bacterium]
MANSGRPVGRFGQFGRYIRFVAALAFLPGYFTMAWAEKWWYLPIIALGALVLGEWWERRTHFLLSPVFLLAFGVSLVALSGWEKSPFLFLFVLAPGTYLLEGELSGALFVCLGNTVFLAMLWGWALWRSDIFALSYILGLGGVMWLLFFFLKEGQNIIARRLLNLEKLVDRDPLTGLGNRRAF